MFTSERKIDLNLGQIILMKDLGITLMQKYLIKQSSQLKKNINVESKIMKKLLSLKFSPNDLMKKKI